MGKKNKGRGHHAPEVGLTHHARKSSHAEPHEMKDSLAHSTHHAHNKEHGAGSFNSPPQYEDGGMDHHLGCNGEQD